MADTTNTVGAEDLAGLYVAVRAGQQQLANDLSEIKDLLAREVESMQSIAGGIDFGLKAGLATLMGVVTGQFIRSANEAEDATARLDQAFKASEYSAGVTTQRVMEYAEALQETSIFGTVMTREAAGMLATFRTLGREEFMQTMAVSADVAAAKGMHLVGVVRMLGRAMDDPERASLALRRFGVNLSEEETSKMRGAGGVEDKQKILLEALTSRFGGQAARMGQTFSGQTARMKNAIGDVYESVGRVLIQLIGPFVGGVTTVMKAFGSLEGKATEVAKVFGGYFKIAVEQVTHAIAKSVEYLNAIPSRYMEMAVQGAKAAVAGIALSKSLMLIGPAIKVVQVALSATGWGAIMVALGALAGLITNKVVDSFGGWSAVIEKLSGVWDSLSASFKTFVDEYGYPVMVLWEGLKEMSLEIWENIKSLAVSLWDLGKAFWESIGGWEGILNSVSSAWDKVATPIKNFVSDHGPALVELFVQYGDIAKSVLTQVVGLVTWVGGIFIDVGKKILASVTGWFPSMDFLGQWFKDWKSFITEIETWTNDLKLSFTIIWEALKLTGMEVLQGFHDAGRSIAERLKGLFRGVWEFFGTGFKTVLKGLFSGKDLPALLEEATIAATGAFGIAMAEAEEKAKPDGGFFGKEIDAQKKKLAELVAKLQELQKLKEEDRKNKMGNWADWFAGFFNKPVGKGAGKEGPKGIAKGGPGEDGKGKGRDPMEHPEDRTKPGFKYFDALGLAKSIQESIRPTKEQNERKKMAEDIAGVKKAGEGQLKKLEDIEKAIAEGVKAIGGGFAGVFG